MILEWPRYHLVAFSAGISKITTKANMQLVHSCRWALDMSVIAFLAAETIDASDADRKEVSWSLYFSGPGA